MGKKVAKKNPGVGVDFKKVKRKVGKKLPKAKNETDVSFKSKKINLPGQSLATESTEQAVSNRKLNLKVWNVHACLCSGAYIISFRNFYHSLSTTIPR
jgi:hypothetical protein